MATNHPWVGKKIPTWFSGDASGLSTVLGVWKYDGKYPQYFTHILRLSAANTEAGWAEMAYNESDNEIQD